MVVGVTYSVDVSLSKLRETVKDREALHAAGHEISESGHNLATEWQLKNTLKNDFLIWKISNDHLYTWFLKKLVKKS